MSQFWMLASGRQEDVIPSVSDLLWWVDFSKPSSITVDGSNRIGTAADLSPNGHDFTQATAGQKPVYTIPGQAGKNTATYDTALGRLLRTADDSNIQNVWDGGGTFIWAFQTDGAEAANVAMILSKSPWLLWYGNDASTANLKLTVPFSGTDLAFATDSTVFALDGSQYVCAVSYNADSVSNTPTFYINGSAVASSGTAPTGTRDTDASALMALGGRWDNSTARCIDGEMFEAALYGRALSSQEILDISQSLMDKWNVS